MSFLEDKEYTEAYRTAVRLFFVCNRHFLLEKWNFLSPLRRTDGIMKVQHNPVPRAVRRRMQIEEMILERVENDEDIYRQQAE